MGRRALQGCTEHPERHEHSLLQVLAEVDAGLPLQVRGQRLVAGVGVDAPAPGWRDRCGPFEGEARGVARRCATVEPGGPAGWSSPSVPSSTATRHASATSSFVTEAQANEPSTSPAIASVERPETTAQAPSPGQVASDARRAPSRVAPGRSTRLVAMAVALVGRHVTPEERRCASEVFLHAPGKGTFSERPEQWDVDLELCFEVLYRAVVACRAKLVPARKAEQVRVVVGCHGHLGAVCQQVSLAYLRPRELSWVQDGRRPPKKLPLELVTHDSLRSPVAGLY